MRTDRLSAHLQTLARNAGTNCESFIIARQELEKRLRAGHSISDSINSKLAIRAFVVILESEFGKQLNVDRDVLEKISELKPRVSYITIESITQYILSKFDGIDSLDYFCDWVKRYRRAKGLKHSPIDSALSPNGAEWFCDHCSKEQTDFKTEMEACKLSQYSQGRFYQLASSIYFLRQLETIPVDKGHRLLEEAKLRAVYGSKFDSKHLLGHKILQVVISRSPNTGVHGDWLGVVMAIAGDPRVTRSHPNYRKWWAVLSPDHQRKVIGWLSRLDLKLFLEAIKNHGVQKGDAELNRMFPSRKVFLEGLLNRELVTGTRLYLSKSAVRYIKANYRDEDLPQLSYVSGGSRSVLHVQLGGVHLIEGSHSCYLWIYPKLDESAIVFDYGKRYASYDDLTSLMSSRMAAAGTPRSARIQHFSRNFKWQQMAIDELNKIGVYVSPSDVLSPSDYRKFKRVYGAGYGV